MVALVLVVVGVVVAVVLATNASEEEKAEDAIVEGFTRWAEAEAGDEGACDGIDEYFVHAGEESAEDACRSEVGSHDGDVPEIVVDRIELDGDRGTARVTFGGVAVDDEDDEDLSYPLELVRVDGTWKVTGG